MEPGRDRQGGSGLHPSITAAIVLIAAVSGLAILALRAPVTSSRPPPAPAAPKVTPAAEAPPVPGSARAAPEPSAAPDMREETFLERSRRTFPSEAALRRMPAFERRKHFDVRAALRAGLTPEEVEALHEKWETAEMAAELTFEDRFGKGRRAKPGPRLYDQLLREHLNDDDFDVVLYSTGQMNRVRIESVEGRPDAYADQLQPGDVIESYDGERIFHLSQLQKLIRAGEEGTVVPYTIRRGNEIIALEAPGRHPLGPKSPRALAPLPR